MDRLKKIIAFLLLINNALFAQNNLGFTSGENCILNTNATTFINGEQLLYTIKCKAENIANPTSKIAYIELIDSQKKSIFKQKVFLNNSTGSGYFTIPMTLQTGYYKLLAYTHKMFSDNFTEVPSINITIINPYVTSSDEKVKTTNDPISAMVNGVSTVEIIPQKEYSNREKISFNLKNVTSNVHSNFVSISIRKKDELDLQFNVTSPSSKITNIGSRRIPELRGEIISGKITSKIATVSVANKNLSLSIPGIHNTVKITKTNKNGEFYFLMEEPYYTNNIIIQCIDEDKESYLVEITKMETDFSKVTFPNELKLSSALKKSIENRLVATQIENSYFEKKQDSLKKIQNTIPFYAIYAKEYKLDDYTRFPTLQETIIEIIDGLTLKKHKENYQFYLKDYDENTNLEIPSLVLVDGLYIQDLKELLGYKAEIFSKISTVKGGYYYGSKLYNGIIALTTKEYNYETKLTGDYIIRPEILRPLQEKISYNPSYEIDTNLVKIPDYRYQLYWNPNYPITEKPIDFYTSDIDGIFEIKLEGYNDKNEYFQQVQYFEVK